MVNSSSSNKRSWHQLAIISGLLAFGATTGSLFLHNRATSQATLTPLVAPLPQDPHIQVFFNQAESAIYTEPYRGLTRYGDDLERVIIEAIAQATTSVDVAVQELNLPSVAEALAKSQRRGVSVRLILENDYSTPEADNREALEIIQAAKVPQIDDTADGSRGSGLMHHKFVVIDNRLVITGSANFTYSGVHGDADDLSSRGNANALLKIADEAVAAQFTEEFNLMWGDGPNKNLDSQFGLQKPLRPTYSTLLPNSRVTLKFSPVSATHPWSQSTNGLIAEILARSQRSIKAALFVFSEQQLANQLETQVSRGTRLQALIDPGFAYRSYSEALDMLGIVIPDHRCKVEAKNKLWTSPIFSVGIPNLPTGDKLHHKFAVIDDSTVVIGSHNWSHAANTNNDETLLVIESATVAAHFNREFERLYKEADLGETSLLTKKKEEGQQRCP